MSPNRLCAFLHGDCSWIKERASNQNDEASRKLQSLWHHENLIRRLDSLWAVRDLRNVVKLRYERQISMKQVKRIPVREKSLCKGPVVGRNMKTTRKQGCHGVPNQLKMSPNWNISWELVPSRKSSAVRSKSQLSKKVSRRNKSWQGEGQKRAPLGAEAQRMSLMVRLSFFYNVTHYTVVLQLSLGTCPIALVQCPPSHVLCRHQVGSGGRSNKWVSQSHQPLGFCFPKFLDGFGA